MTIETLPDEVLQLEDLRYYLIAYDKDGREHRDDPDAPGGLLSELIKKGVQEYPVTDVFLISHGWKGDVLAAKEQYVSWIKAMLQCKEDRLKMREVRPGFRPLLIGLHWPSLPWGDEEVDDSGASCSPAEDPMAPLVDDAADKIANTDAARKALRTIFTAAFKDISPSSLPKDVADAYRTLQQEAGLAAEGIGAIPGSDTETFDPEQMYQAGENQPYNSLIIGALLGPLRKLSFWKMKKRASEFGESGAATLLRELQEVTDDTVRFHLMGHSFGCIVVSAAIAGAGGDSPLLRPVDSLFLVQGPLSLWSYCSDIPTAPGKAGYFHSIIGKNKVGGAILATLSEHDIATATMCPIGVANGQQTVQGSSTPPHYGALGEFGIQGPGTGSKELKMLSVDGNYGFQSGKVYNLESSRIICNGDGVSGAHNDIVHPEVAHAFWEAVMVEKQSSAFSCTSDEKSSQSMEFTVTTSISSDISQADKGTIAVQTQVSEGSINTVVAQEQAENAQLLSLHQALTEKALEAWKKK